MGKILSSNKYGSRKKRAAIISILAVLLFALQSPVSAEHDPSFRRFPDGAILKAYAELESIFPTPSGCTNYHANVSVFPIKSTPPFYLAEHPSPFGYKWPEVVRARVTFRKNPIGFRSGTILEDSPIVIDGQVRDSIERYAQYGDFTVRWSGTVCAGRGNFVLRMEVQGDAVYDGTPQIVFAYPR